MVGLANDLRYALRILLRNPSFTATAVVVLALGIGASSIAFSFVNSVLLRPLPVREPHRLVRIFATYAQGPRYFTLSYADHLLVRDLAHVFSGVVADEPSPVHLSSRGVNERIWAYRVSPNYFSELGLQPALGRLFLGGADEDQPVIVLSHEFWRRRFGGTTEAVGATVAVNGRLHTVIGIAPRGFHGVHVGLKPELWTPARIEDRQDRGYFVMARLRPGVTVAQAAAALQVLGRRLQTLDPASHRDLSFSVLPEAEGGVHPMVRGAFVGFSATLATVFGLVLLLACVNVAGLLLVRGAARRREVGVRLALGASRRRIVRQLLTEAVLLWLLGGTLGTGLAVAGVKTLSLLPLPTDRPLFVDVGVDARVLAFSIAATLTTGLAFGLVPATTAARMDVVASLKAASRPLTWRSPLRGALVASQVALCVVLLVGAGLCLRSLANARRIDLGFEPAGVGMASVDLKLHGYDDGRSEGFWSDLQARLSALPGVEAVGFTNRLPFELNIIRLPAAPSDDEALRLPSVDFAVVDRGYFPAMRIALRQGRPFGPSGMPSSASEVVINETLARRFWPKGEALGRRIAVGGGRLEVVGIAADGRYLTLGEEPTPFLYLPFRGREAADMTMLLRTTNPLAGHQAASMLRREIGALDSTLPARNVKTLREHLAIALLPAGVSAALLGAFAGLALLLASVGLYGLLAHAVAQRTHEIGVRRALGALDLHVILLVVRQGMAPVIVGLGAGTALGFVVSPVLGSVLYGIGAADPAAHAGAVIILILTAAVACGAPAIGATRVDPMAALRQD